MVRLQDGRWVSCRPVFKKLEILPLPSLYILEILCFTFDNIHQLTTSAQTHRYNTRHHNRILLPRHETCLFEQQDLYVGAKLYNLLPSEIREIQSRHSFKNKCKQMLTENVFYSVDEFVVFCSC